MTPVPNSGLILDKEVVREKLNVFGGILHVVALSQHSSAKLPRAVGPAAHIAQRFHVCPIVAATWRPRPPIAISDSVHQKHQADNASAVHESRSPRRKPPGVIEYFSDCP